MYDISFFFGRCAKYTWIVRIKSLNRLTQNLDVVNGATVLVYSVNLTSTMSRVRSSKRKLLERWWYTRTWTLSSIVRGDRIGNIDSFVCLQTRQELERLTEDDVLVHRCVTSRVIELSLCANTTTISRRSSRSGKKTGGGLVIASRSLRSITMVDFSDARKRPRRNSSKALRLEKRRFLFATNERN